MLLHSPYPSEHETSNGFIHIRYVCTHHHPANNPLGQYLTISFSAAVPHYASRKSWKFTQVSYPGLVLHPSMSNLFRLGHHVSTFERYCSVYRQKSESSQDFYYRDAYPQMLLCSYIPPRSHWRVSASLHLPRRHASEPQHVTYNGGVRCTE